MEQIEKLTGSTAKTYASNLRRLERLTGKFFKEAVRDPKGSVEAVEASSLGVSAKKGALTLPFTLFKHGLKLNQNLTKQWTAINKRWVALGNKAQTSNVLSEKKQEQQLLWSEVMEGYEKAEGDDRLLLAMYVLQPPRRAGDYAVLNIVKKVKDVQSGGNYLILPRSGVAKLVIDNFKTSKTLGTYKTDLSADLTKMIRASLRATPRPRLFMLDEDHETASNQMSKLVVDTMQRVYGRGSINALRHSYVNYFLQKNPNATTGDKKALALSMGQSDIGTQDAYRTLDAPKPEYEVIERDGKRFYLVPVEA
jgi:hypothetical protein